MSEISAPRNDAAIVAEKISRKFGHVQAVCEVSFPR